MNTIEQISLNRRQFAGLGLGSVAAFGLAACGGSNPSSGAATTAAATTAAATEAVKLEDEQEAPEVDAKQFDQLVAGIAPADDATIAASAWAKAVKDAGKLRVGGVKTSTFFSLLNEEDGRERGFDAGLFQMLTRYILGDETKYELTQVTSDTRESVLTNGQVDCVFATYSILPERQKLIDFAGPYYTSQQSILVKKDNDSIKSVADLADKNVAVQSGSSGPSIMEEEQPKAVLQEFSTDEEARSALEQGRVDAYVIDNAMQMGAVARNPSKYKIVGEPFGPTDPYGIGLPKDAAGAVDFVNGFLKKIEDEGVWESLWHVCIGSRTNQETAPQPPAIGA